MWGSTLHYNAIISQYTRLLSYLEFPVMTDKLGNGLTSAGKCTL
jgi:hypothetical protein